MIESLPSLYFSDVSKKEDTEDVDTDDDDDTTLISTKPAVENAPPPLFEHINATSKLGLNKKMPLLSSSSYSQLNSLTPIQTYLPQLNHSFYSPTSSVVSSIRSKKSSRYNYPLSSHSENASTCSTPEVPLPNTAQKRITPLYSMSNTNSDIKAFYPVHSPPVTANPSSSRIKNVFQKLRPTTSKASHHQNTNTNSIVPAELVPATIKLASVTKNSLADKIRNKFQQQLDKTKRSSLIEVSSKAKSSLSSSVPRSSSLSSLSNWSSRLSSMNKKNSSNVKRLSSSVTMTNLRNTPLVSHHSIASSVSSTISDEDDEDEKKINAAATPFSLKKSMSSHKLYTHKKKLPSSNNTLMVLEVAGNGNKKDNGVVRFHKMVSVRETFSKSEYDRASDPDAVCTRLTPVIAQQIKDELNTYKLHEMKVHESSRGHTHFFL